MSESSWAAYYARAGLGPPRATLLRAIAAFGAARPLTAVDLGCGIGRDTLELLRQGFEVTAIDSEPTALQRLEAHAAEMGLDAGLRTVGARMEDAGWPIADLVNSSFALPLCPPKRFPGLWQCIRASLAPGGRLACQLYGPRDGWAGRSGITFHDRGQILGLLEGLEIELLDEEETDGTTRNGTSKHWHIFHINATRSAS